MPPNTPRPMAESLGTMCWYLTTKWPATAVSGDWWRLIPANNDADVMDGWGMGEKGVKTRF
jgi:hypothetical protein